MKRTPHPHPTLFDYPQDASNGASHMPNMDLTDANLHDHDVYGNGELISRDQLPGPLSFAMLERDGALCPMDSQHAYLRKESDTLFGRAAILYNLLPLGSRLCCTTAAWVWMGGKFPRTLDILSRSRYRQPVHGRSIRSFSRQVPTTHMITIAQIGVTKPVRTVCDLVTLPFDEIVNLDLHTVARSLMLRYGVTGQQCLHILEDAPYLHNRKYARSILEFFMEVDERDQSVLLDPSVSSDVQLA